MLSMVNKVLDNNSLSICTIVSKNYLAYARVVAESFLKHNKGEVFVLLVDRVDGYFKPEEERFKLIEIEDLREVIPEFDKFCFQYTILELNTAVKPYLLEYLFKKYGIRKLAYFDPDILITDSLGELSGLLDRYSVILTPHLTAPIEDDYTPSEIEILKSGAYNLGFVALSNTAVTERMLRWWQRRLHDRCIVAFEKGLFVDQKWMDLVPGLYEDVLVLREPGYNVAYWNYHCRDVAIEGDKISVNGRPAYFFHFSGFDAGDLKPISKYQNRYTLDMLENMRPLFELYRDMVLAGGWNETRKWPYCFASFDNGVKIPPVARRVFLEMGAKSKNFGNPFKAGERSFFKWLNEPVKSDTPSITRLLYAIYLARPDIHRNFPNIFGDKRSSFLAWIVTNGKKDYNLDEAFLKHAYAGGEAKTGFKLKLHLYRSVRGATDLAGRTLIPLLKRNRRVMDLLIRLNSRISSTLSIKTSNDILGSITAVNSAMLDRNPGINVAGYIASESGTGEAARANIRAIEAAGIPCALNNLKSQSRQGESTYTNFSDDNPYGVNLIHVNADQVKAFFIEKGIEYFNNRYNIGFWYWELANFPDEWHDRFRYFNEIWVASSFCQESISKASPVPVVKIPPSVTVDRIKDVDRSHFGLKKETFVFFYLFDYLSFFERKNPLAVIKAFKTAFKPGEDATLVIKCSNSEWNKEARERLVKEAEGLNVRFIDRYLDKEEINALMAASDCYVSLHRSEGFGLPLAEAMYLKKPVIATGYSGNTDFMNVNNSFPVKYSLVEIEKDSGPYKKGNLWAEPDTDHASELMRLVFEKRDLAAKTGEIASRDIKANLNPQATGKMISERLKSIIEQKDESE